MSNPTLYLRCGNLWKHTRLTEGFAQRSYSKASKPSPPQPSPKRPRGQPAPIDIDSLLSNPTWTPASLLPMHTALDEPQVTPAQLRHLLRLSALPQPKDDFEEASMLKTLEGQLHFVRDVQGVDTTGIEPLRAIREETAEAEVENTIGVEALKEALEQEERIGRHKRPRRRRDLRVDTKGVEDWDVLGLAERKEGKYFVVDGRKNT